MHCPGCPPEFHLYLLSEPNLVCLENLLMSAPASRPFRPWNLAQIQLLPPSVQDYVPPGHPAHLIRDLAAHAPGLSEVYAGYTIALFRQRHGPALQGLFPSIPSAMCEGRDDSTTSMTWTVSYTPAAGGTMSLTLNVLSVDHRPPSCRNENRQGEYDPHAVQAGWRGRCNLCRCQDCMPMP